jgi:hypothetical protein
MAPTSARQRLVVSGGASPALHTVEARSLLEECILIEIFPGAEPCKVICAPRTHRQNDYEEFFALPTHEVRGELVKGPRKGKMITMGRRS